MISSRQSSHEEVKGKSSSLPKPVIDERRLRYSLDIISDGSAFTGDGTLIFSILRGSAASLLCSSRNNSATSNGSGTSSIDNCDEEEVIVQRYSFGYCENMGRLLQDQKQKISKVTAVFLPKTNVAATSGIPSLLLALSDTGATEQITMVGPPPLRRYINFITHMFLNKRLYPKVNLCEIPTTHHQSTECKEKSVTQKRSYDGETKKRMEDSTTNHSIDESPTWWSVYNDEYVHVYARIYHGATTAAVTSSEKVQRGTSDNTTVYTAYIVSVLGSNGRNVFSFSIAPKNVQLSPLPELIDVSSSKSKPFKFSIYWTDYIPEDVRNVFHGSYATTSLANFTYEINKRHDASKVDVDEMENECQWDAGIVLV
jgi:hypothetical protein